MLPHDAEGDAAPAVLLLHAGIADRAMWTELRDHLRPSGRKVVAVDLPGFGEAEPARDLDAPWDDVLRTADALGLERLVLIGCSFGAAVALRIAASAPERIAGLLLCSTPMEDVAISHELASAWEAEEVALAAGDIGAAVDIVLDAWLLPDAAPSCAHGSPVRSATRSWCSAPHRPPRRPPTRSPSTQPRSSASMRRSSSSPAAATAASSTTAPTCSPPGSPAHASRSSPAPVTSRRSRRRERSQTSPTSSSRASTRPDAQSSSANRSAFRVGPVTMISSPSRSTVSRPA